MLDVLVRVHQTVADPEYVAICQCLQFLNRASEVAQILDDLVRGPEEKALLAYQVAFDLVESENQHFLLDVNNVLFSSSSSSATTTPEGTEGEAKAAEGEGATAAAAPVEDKPLPEGAHPDYWKRMAQLKQVLLEGFSIDLTLDFLYRQNNTDLLILKNIKVRT